MNKKNGENERIKYYTFRKSIAKGGKGDIPQKYCKNISLYIYKWKLQV